MKLRAYLLLVTLLVCCSFVSEGFARTADDCDKPISSTKCMHCNVGMATICGGCDCGGATACYKPREGLVCFPDKAVCDTLGCHDYQCCGIPTVSQCSPKSPRAAYQCCIALHEGAHETHDQDQGGSPTSSCGSECSAYTDTTACLRSAYSYNCQGAKALTQECKALKDTIDQSRAGSAFTCCMASPSHTGDVQYCEAFCKSNGNDPKKCESKAKSYKDCNTPLSGEAYPEALPSAESSEQFPSTDTATGVTPVPSPMTSMTY